MVGRRLDDRSRGRYLSRSSNRCLVRAVTERPDIDIFDGVWICHVCKDERPDAVIGVYTIPHTSITGVGMTINVRYCTDRPECVAGAPDVAEAFAQRLSGHD